MKPLDNGSSNPNVGLLEARRDEILAEMIALMSELDVIQKKLAVKSSFNEKKNITFTLLKGGHIMTLSARKREFPGPRTVLYIVGEKYIDLGDVSSTKGREEAKKLVAERELEANDLFLFRVSPKNLWQRLDWQKELKRKPKGREEKYKPKRFSFRQLFPGPQKVIRVDGIYGSLGDISIEKARGIAAASLSLGKEVLLYRVSPNGSRFRLSLKFSERGKRVGNKPKKSGLSERQQLFSGPQKVLRVDGKYEGLGDMPLKKAKGEARKRLESGAGSVVLYRVSPNATWVKLEEQSFQSQDIDKPVKEEPQNEKGPVEVSPVIPVEPKPKLKPESKPRNGEGFKQGSPQKVTSIISDLDLGDKPLLPQKPDTPKPPKAVASGSRFSQADRESKEQDVIVHESLMTRMARGEKIDPEELKRVSQGGRTHNPPSHGMQRVW